MRKVGYTQSNFACSITQIPPAMQGSFEGRHIGPQSEEQKQMLQAIGAKTLDQLIDETVPSSIRSLAPA